MAKTTNQQGVYAKIESRSDEIFETLFRCLSSKNEAIALGAAKILANKIIPDKKEITGENGEPIKLSIITGNGFTYIPTSEPSASTSTTSIVTEPSAV